MEVFTTCSVRLPRRRKFIFRPWRKQPLIKFEIVVLASPQYRIRVVLKTMALRTKIIELLAHRRTDAQENLRVFPLRQHPFAEKRGQFSATNPQGRALRFILDDS
jgi:hypothetical protein